MLDTINAACIIDMCVATNQTTLQNKLRCDHYEAFDQRCTSLGQANEPNWRSQSGCSVSCDANRVYEYRKACPKTCADMTGSKCSSTVGLWGCFCMDGYVEDASGKCVETNKCGCPLTDGSYLPVPIVVTLRMDSV